METADVFLVCTWSSCYFFSINESFKYLVSERVRLAGLPVAPAPADTPTTNTVASELFFSHHPFSHCSVVTVHGAGEARISGSAGSGSGTLQCIRSVEAESPQSRTKRALRGQKDFFPSINTA